MEQKKKKRTLSEERAEKQGLALLKKMLKYMEDNKVAPEAQEEFFYQCSQRSQEMNREFSDVYSHYMRVLKENRAYKEHESVEASKDNRVKFSKNEKRRIRKTYRTKGEYSYQKTALILRQQGTAISERHVSRICSDIERPGEKGEFRP